jgi:hypothetical protein
MVIVEVLTAALVAALALVTLLVMCEGLGGILGMIRFARCNRCGHLGMTSATEPIRACIRCRHGHLLHPLLALHHHGEQLHERPQNRSAHRV